MGDVASPGAVPSRSPPGPWGSTRPARAVPPRPGSAGRARATAASAGLRCARSARAHIWAWRSAAHGKVKGPLRARARAHSRSQAGHCPHSPAPARTLALPIHSSRLSLPPPRLLTSPPPPPLASSIIFWNSRSKSSSCACACARKGARGRAQWCAHPHHLPRRLRTSVSRAPSGHESPLIPLEAIPVRHPPTSHSVVSPASSPTTIRHVPA
jgi:hypothetical protein